MAFSSYLTTFIVIPLLAFFVYLVFDHEFVPSPPMQPYLPTDPVEAERNAVYDMKKPVGPVLKGPILKIFATILRTPIIGPMLASKLASDNGFDELIDFTSRIEHQFPMYFPYRIPSQEEIEQHEAINKKEAAKVKSQQGEETSNADNNKSNSLVPSWVTHSRIANMHRAFVSGKLDVVENMKRTIENIEKSDTDSDIPLRAFVFVNKEAAIKAAQESAERYKKGKPLSILDGIPVGVKCELAIKGLPETIGSRITEFMKIPEESVTPVKRLEEAGALATFFSTNMHEIGLGTSGFSSFISPLHPTKGSARNPFNRSRITGGSSSGSAAAVASGLVPLALGADGGGSISLPAGICGSIGLKATFQRVPFPEEAQCFTVGHVGPHASTIDDARIALEIISQKKIPSNKVDQFPQPPLSFPEYTDIKSLKGIRVGVYREWINDAKPIMRQVVSETEAKLKKLGAEIVEIKIPNLRALFLSHVTTIVSEMIAPMDKFGRKNQSKMEYETQISLRAFETLTARLYVHAAVAKTYFYDVVTKGIIFKKCDVMLTPNTANTAVEAAEEPEGMINLQETADRMLFQLLGNLVGVPRVAVPTERMEEGTNLPTAVLLHADHWQEGKMLRVAKAIEPKEIVKPKFEKTYYEDL